MIVESLAAAFDWLLAGLLVLIALVTVFSRTLVVAITSFIVVGLLLAMAWARLGAADLALAEVVLGAGILGGLLLRAASQFVVDEARSASPSSRTSVTVLPVAVPAAAIAAGVVLVGLTASGGGGPVPGLVARLLPQTGVQHPITAVLLDYRAFDTLLELAVLLVATVAGLAVGRGEAPTRSPGHVLEGLLKVVVPLLVLCAGVLLWRGATAPGGAFQAGAALGAALILLLLAGHGAPGAVRGAGVLLALGVGVFSAAGIATALAGNALLDWPASHAGAVILVIESAATVSIACALVLLFLGGQPRAQREDLCS